MPEFASRIDSVIMVTFILAVISIVYFLASVYLLGSDTMLAGIPESYFSWMVLERLVLVGTIIVILVVITYVLLGQKYWEESIRKPPASADYKKGEKEIKADIMRYYRDLGALKIVLKDGALDAQTYNDRKKYLEDMIKKRKQELKKFR